MLATRTGQFPIGFRRLFNSPWQQDVPALITWCKKLGFAHLDLGWDAPTSAPAFLAAGLGIGSADLLDWPGLISPDANRRRGTVEKNAAYIRQCTALGIRNFFLVMLPEKPELSRKENFAFMVDSLTLLGSTLDETGGYMGIEGWPGPGALCCNPETLRATFRECPSRRIGINYDPSHLIRMQIDPLRFLEEFADRIFHVHGKDAEIFSEHLYDYGSEQPSAFGHGHDFGGFTWRYTIPGQGQFRWRRGLEILAAHHYKGVVSVELEDERFTGSEAAEQRGLIASGHYLMTC